MKYSRLLIALAAVITVPALGADVGVSISIGQPGFYGQIELGSYGRPEVVYRRPMIIERIPRGEVREPLYLRVPSGHARNWRRYCSRYDACGRPVYFVKTDWYNNVYAPRYREEHHGNRDNRDDRHNDNDRGNRNDRDNNRGNDRDRRNDR